MIGNEHDPENGKNNPEALGGDDQSKSMAAHRKSVQITRSMIAK